MGGRKSEAKKAEHDGAIAVQASDSFISNRKSVISIYGSFLDFYLK